MSIYFLEKFMAKSNGCITRLQNTLNNTDNNLMRLDFGYGNGYTEKEYKRKEDYHAATISRNAKKIC